MTVTALLSRSMVIDAVPHGCSLIAVTRLDLQVLISYTAGLPKESIPDFKSGPVAGLVGIEGGVVSGVFNLESPGVRAPGRRPRHDQRYHEA